MRTALLYLPLCSCTVQSVDLRGVEVKESATHCAAGERFDPATEACAPCVAREPHPAVACPCSYTYVDGEFPICKGQDYVCEACTGDINSCSAFNPVSGTAWNCGLLIQCCDQLLADPGSQPCCPGGGQVVCTPTDYQGQYDFACAGSACCTGVACPNGNGDCESWQTCDGESGTCTPACEPEVETCCQDCGCECRASGEPT
jgi:hypothetical protein